MVTGIGPGLAINEAHVPTLVLSLQLLFKIMEVKTYIMILLFFGRGVWSSLMQCNDLEVYLH